MGSCCGHQLQCKASADEGKSLLNTDTNRKQTSTENIKEDEHKDGAYEEG